MKKTTWTGKYVNGKVLPAKTERVIENSIVSAMKAKLEERELSL